MDTCINCKYYHSSTGAGGFCRAHAPVPTSATDSSTRRPALIGAFPFIPAGKENKCGDWKPDTGQPT